MSHEWKINIPCRKLIKLNLNKEIKRRSSDGAHVTRFVAMVMNEQNPMSYGNIRFPRFRRLSVS